MMRSFKAFNHQPQLHIKKKTAMKTILNTYKIPKQNKISRQHILQISIYKVLNVAIFHSKATKKKRSKHGGEVKSWAGPCTFPSRAALFWSTADVWNMICEGLGHPLSVWKLALCSVWRGCFLCSLWTRKKHKNWTPRVNHEAFLQFGGF